MKKRTPVETTAYYFQGMQARFHFAMASALKHGDLATARVFQRKAYECRQGVEASLTKLLSLTTTPKRR